MSPKEEMGRATRLRKEAYDRYSDKLREAKRIETEAMDLFIKECASLVEIEQDLTNKHIARAFDLLYEKCPECKLVRDGELSVRADEQGFYFQWVDQPDGMGEKYITWEDLENEHQKQTP